MMRQRGRGRSGVMGLILLGIFVFLIKVPEVGRFVFSNLYFVLGPISLFLLVGLMQMAHQAALSQNSSIWNALFIPTTKDASTFVTITTTIKNSFIASFITMIIAAVPLFFIDVPLIVRHHSTDFLANTIMGYFLIVLFIFWQVYAGYCSLFIFEKRAWLYGLCTFAVYTLSFGILIIVLPCHSYTCRQSSTEVIASFMQNPLQTYGTFALFGAVLGAGQLIGGVLASVFHKKTQSL